jgi:hypothetical protein
MMKRKSYTEEQIISILKEHEASILAPDRPSAGFFLRCKRRLLAYSVEKLCFQG